MLRRYDLDDPIAELLIEGIKSSSIGNKVVHKEVVSVTAIDQTVYYIILDDHLFVGDTSDYKKLKEIEKRIAYA